MRWVLRRIGIVLQGNYLKGCHCSVLSQCRLIPSEGVERPLPLWLGKLFLLPRKTHLRAQCPQLQKIFPHIHIPVFRVPSLPIKVSVDTLRSWEFNCIVVSQLQDGIMSLTVSNLSQTATGDKGLLQGIYRRLQIFYMTLELGI